MFVILYCYNEENDTYEPRRINIRHITDFISSDCQMPQLGSEVYLSNDSYFIVKESVGAIERKIKDVQISYIILN